MNELLKSGALIDVAVACIGVELLALLGVRRLRGGLRVADVIGQLLAGALLLLAVRCAAVAPPTTPAAAARRR